MACVELPDDLKTRWKEAGANPPMLSLDEFRREANRLRARRRRGYMILGAVLALIIAAYAFGIFVFPRALARLGATLSVLACGYWLLHTLLEWVRVEPDPGNLDGLRFYRAQLERARDSSRWMSWRWLLLVGPLILFDIGVAQTYVKTYPLIVPFAGFDSALLLAVLAIWAPRKHFRTARKYQERIDALDSAAKSAGQVGPQG